MIREHLEAIRQTAAAIVAQCDALLAAVAVPPSASCTHQHSVDASTMGTAQRFCGDCGTVFTP